MVEVIPKHIKDVWDRWNIRGAVILSLTLQAILICFSPLRKRTSRRLLIILVWTSYLLADWSANFAVGLISKNQGKDPKPEDPPQDKKMMALWAPFLLLHLGGPDTITAFALEDNALWLRHVFGFVFQTIAGVYVFFQSLPNSLWVIILLVFLSGTIKYLERTMALYNASVDNFRDSMIQVPDPGPNYAKLMDEYKAKTEARLPTKIIVIDEVDRYDRPTKVVHPKNVKSAGGIRRKTLHDLEIVQYAYMFFNTFKGLVVNLIFSRGERDESLEIFENLCDPAEALRIIEVELGFLYDALFTKIAVLHTLMGSISRVVASISLIIAFILFHYKPNKSREFHGADIVVTYTLFIVGLALDFISILLFVFSDWTYAALSSLKYNPENALSSWTDQVFNWLISRRKLRWKEQKCNHHKSTKEGNTPCIKEGDDKCSRVHHVLTTGFFLRRWCGSINVFNFLDFATTANVRRIHDTRGRFQRYSCAIITFPLLKLYSIIEKLSGWVANMVNGVHGWISHIVNETSRKHPLARRTIYPFYFGFLSRIPDFIKFLLVVITECFIISDMLNQVYKSQFVHGEPMTKELWEFIFNELKDKSKYGDSPHNAKMISLARGEWTLQKNLPEDFADNEKMVRYVTKVDYDQSILMWHIATELCYQKDKKIDETREFSKIISDYMMYLLIFQPGLMSEVVGIGKIRFADTLAEANEFFHRRHINNCGDLKITSNAILGVNTEIDPLAAKGDRSKSVLFAASKLAKDLGQLEEKYGKNKWEILSKVWVELLCYAASRCNSKAHVEQLSRGAELINFVWLLMSHFGLTPQFRINRGGKAILKVGK